MRFMKTTLSLIGASLLWSACSLAGPLGGRAEAAGQPFVMQPGEDVRVSGTGLRLSFIGVVRDSRCPRGEQCVSAGSAVVRLAWQVGDAARVVREATVGDGRPAPVPLIAGGQMIELLDLQPQPVSGRPIDAAQYRLTMKVQAVVVADPAAAQR